MVPPRDRALIRSSRFVRALAVLPLAAGLLVTYPLLRFMLLPLFPALGPAAPPGDGPGLGLAIGNSLRLAVLCVACTLPLAVWLAFLLERRRWPGARLLEATLLLLFLLPAYLTAAGWEIVLGGVPKLSVIVLGWPGLVGMMALKALPVATFVARAGWSIAPPRLADATRLHVRSRWRRWGLSIRPVVPAAISAALIVFIEATHEYGLAATLGAQLHLPLLVAEVYASLSTWPISWTRAALAGDIMMLVALAPLAASLAAGRRGPPLDRMLTTPLGPATPAESALGTIALAALFLIGCAVPLAALGTDALLPTAEILPEGAVASIGVALMYAFVGALGAVVLAASLVASQSIGQGSGLARVLGWLPLGNLAIPGIVLGAADVIAFNGPPLPLLGTPLALLAAQVATQFPMLALLLKAPMRSRQALAGEAARVHGLRLLDRVERVHLPPLLRPLAWAWCLAFGKLFFELPLAQMLAPAGGEPVSVVLVQLQHALRFGAEARLSMAALIVCALIVGVVMLAAERTR